MQKHVKVYMEFFGWDGVSYLPCECGCERPIVEIHHLVFRSLEPNKKKRDAIENLCGVARECHDKAHASRAFNEELKVIHRKNCLKNGYPETEVERFLTPKNETI